MKSWRHLLLLLPPVLGLALVAAGITARWGWEYGAIACGSLVYLDHYLPSRF